MSQKIENISSSLNLAVDGYPIPPEELRWRVVGNKNADAFINSGTRTAKYFEKLISSSGKNLTEFESILDFGCGSGRVLRGISSLTKARLTGCDIDEEMISWCNQFLTFGKFYATGEYPPLPFKDNEFDFIYAISVLTHLDEEHQFKWLQEWKRVTKPGGLLIITFTGWHNLEKLKDNAKMSISEELKKHGFHYRVTKFWNEVFPEYYQQAFHTPEYVQTYWSKYFEILKIDPPKEIAQYSALMRNT